MKKYEKTILATAVTSCFVTAVAGEALYVVIVEGEYLTVNGEVDRNISEWFDIGVPYDCAVWTPDPSTRPLGLNFDQTRDCLQDQNRTKDVHSLISDGSERFLRTEEENQTVTVEKTKSAVGTLNYIGSERLDSWSSWVNDSTRYNCGTWLPEASTIDYGQSFTQYRDCSQDQTRNRNVYDVWADGSETLNRNEIDAQVITETESFEEIGTKNFISVDKINEWGSWTNVGVPYDCTVWTPDPSTINYGEDFIQSRDCSQDQDRSRDIYDVWADGTETLNRTEAESQTIINEETLDEIGTLNYIDNERVEDWGTWTNTGVHYDCETWSPDASTITYGDDFTQTRDCSQDQDRSRDVYDVWADGSETFNRTETESQTITEEESQLETGTDNFIDTERSDAWSVWSNVGIHYDCEIWSPLPSAVNYGISFSSSRDCSQEQTRSRDVYNVWADGTESFNRTETSNQVISETENDIFVGTLNYIASERIDAWKLWVNTGIHYDCGVWSPSPASVTYGEDFVQSRDCSQDQDRERDVYDVWADGSETLNRIEGESHTIIEVETQDSVGEDNYIDSEQIGAWGAWTNVSGHYSCGVWTPLESTVPYGQSFTQNRDCSQDQERTRDVHDLWADGSLTLNRVETDTDTIIESESQPATGSDNFISNERANNWSGWADVGNHYGCETWTPSTETVPYGQSFTQNRDCSQDQERTRDVYDVWADGSETLNRTETDDKTITENETQPATGSDNFISTERANAWGNWVDVDGHYACEVWSPLEATVDYGQSFTQNRDCSQDQERTRDVYNVWADGSETLNRTETDAHTITEGESQSATGSRNFVSNERNAVWGGWTDTGIHYNCDTWSPLASTVPYGQSFTQNRNCSQDQERERNVYNVWADGSETLNRIEGEEKTITEGESQPETGTKNFVSTERNDSWGSWVDTGSHYGCEDWSPLPSTVPYGQSFTQNRDCSQNQERTRDVYNVWADGSETLNRTEIDDKTITESESQPATGTKNFVSTERNGSWSSWIDVGAHDNCGTWSPLTSTVDYGQSFTQNRDCSQDQERTRTVYNVWADGSETSNRTETDDKIITVSESQPATGTKNFIASERADSWSSWIDVGTHDNCGTWSPLTSTVSYGQSFTQNRDCSQDQERTRTVYNVWADGSETSNRTETDDKIITVSESQPATGTKNFIASERDGSWTAWSNTGSQSCEDWTPSASTITYGVSFNQTRDCSQDQERERDVYNVWANGSETLNRVEQENHTITLNESQISVGTLNYIASEQLGNWSAWSNVGVAYNCTDWTPGVETIDSGESFTQTRACYQDQENTRDIHDVWADGTTTFNRVETGYNTELVNENQEAVGEKPTNGLPDGFEVIALTDTAMRNAYFGAATALDGNHLAVGGYGYNSNKGIVKTYYKSGGNWVAGQELLAPSGNSYTYFGTSVSVSGNVMVVGARGDLSPISSVKTGVAYVYRYNNGSWSHEATLSGSESLNGDYFGYASDVDGNRIVVGSKYADPNGLSSSGEAYVFEYTGGSWVETQKLVSSDPFASDNFAESVAISGNRIAIGVPAYDGINYLGNPSSALGAVEVFDYSGSTWVSSAMLQAERGNYSDYLGRAVDIDGNRIIAGSTGEDTTVSNSGAAYVFEYSNGNWTESFIKASNPTGSDSFGYDVAISGSKIVVGSRSEDSIFSGSGAAYVYEKVGNTWVESMYKAFDVASSTFLGSSVSIDGSRIVAGASYRVSDDATSRAGAAYVIDTTKASKTTPQ